MFLFGAELNSELEHQTAKDTTQGTQKPLGQRGAWSADHVAESDEPSKPGADGVAPPRAQPSQDLAERPSAMQVYVAARATNRAARVAGMQKVGMISAALSTIGLSMLRKKGRGRAGAALVAGAVGLALMKRED